MSDPWHDDPRQRVWLWIGLLFFAFYFTEAILFWGPEPRVLAPAYTPLVFWGLFGAALITLITRPNAAGQRPKKHETAQSWILGTTITASAVGSAFLIIRRTGDITLGHIILLFVLAQAALIFGAMTFNAGWLSAGLCWCGAGIWILIRPAGQDYVLGAAVALGFLLIGTFRKHLVV